MAHIILTGCTGTAGAAVLARCIESSTISTISVLSRRPVKQAAGHEKVKVILHQDFTSYPTKLLEEQLKGATACIWALGISVSLASPSDYKKITLDYTLAAAKAFASLSPHFNFVYISGDGATRTPGHFSPLFARTKGQAELSLLALRETGFPSLRIFNVRPGFIDDRGKPLKDGAKHFSYRVMDAAAPVFRTLWPSAMIPTTSLADVLVRCCAEETNGRDELAAKLAGKGVTVEDGERLGVLIENVGLRRLAGL
ncbi:hypothetical protein MMC22_006559 [Lobaria immixta]|nr:hypothetical protein [Lobaria immixta]